jgi:hypothetical protein
VLTIAADVPMDRESHIQLQTEWEVRASEGGTVQPIADGLVGLTFAASPSASLPEHYRRATAVVELKPQQGSRMGRVRKRVP